jgi:hypothetical protein
VTGGSAVIVRVSEDGGGIEWWGIALIALGAAVVAAIVTELVDKARERHHGGLAAPA